MAEKKKTQAEQEAAAVESTEQSDVSSEELDEVAQSDWTEPTPTVEDLEAALAEAHRISDDFNERLLRSQAEMENLRRRTERDLENAHKYALERVAGDLLAVRDSLEMGLDAASKPDADVAKLNEGMGLTLKQLAALMDKNGIKEINPLNEKFNPEFHQAMTVQESASVEPNMVLVVFQKGYTLNDRLLRPAMVVVSKAAASSGGNEEGGNIDEMA